ncbi:MAG: sulfotransferase, partial [Fimbriimonadaceae bacterium]|nr:sulfotransferase [Fimbriimonadaceae bacterium]
KLLPMRRPHPLADPRQLALQALQTGQLNPAAKHVEVAIRRYPDDPDTFVLAAMIANQRRQNDVAEAHLKTALALDSLHLEALVVMSRLLAATGRIPEAIPYAEAAALVAPADPDIWNHLGLLLIQARRFADAAVVFGKAVRADEHHLPSRTNYANALRDSGREQEAIEQFQRLSQTQRKDLNVWMNLARLTLAHGRFAEAVAAAEQAVRLAPQDSTAQLMMALALTENMQGESAEPYLHRAIELDSENALAKAALGYWYQQKGEFAASLPLLEDAMAKMPTHGFAYYNYLRAKKAYDLAPGFLDALRDRLETPGLHTRDRTDMSYALGKAYEDLRDYESASTYYSRANELAYQTWLAAYPWERDQYSQRMSHTIATFTPARLDALKADGLTDATPIIIVGMMRSGTSLLEQILSSHPDVMGAGELPFWHDFEEEAYDEGRQPNPAKLRALGERYLADLRRLSHGRPRVTDKMPHNYAMLGLIHATFPNAKIVHVRRSPADNCLSIYTTAYQRPPVFAHDRQNIVFAYREYQRIVAHWRQTLPPDRFFELEYEDLIARRDELTRELIDFAELPWDEACLHHESNQRAVRTPSLWQVRQPIYNTSVERWRRFEPWIPEFAALAA